MTSLDKLTIDTPEQTALEFPLAGIGSRFLALAIDLLIQFIAFLVLFLGFSVLSGALNFWLPGASTWAMAGFVLMIFLLTFGYFAFFEALWNGQTPGKRYTRLRVIKDSGRPITVNEAIARNLLRIVDQMPGIYAVGIVTMLISRQNKRLGDYVAGTVVVHEKPLEDVKPAWEVAEKPMGVVYQAARLSAEEFELIETFLQRRAFLSEDVRRDMARQIADRMARTLSVASEQRPSAEAFLEALAQERRALGAR
ncbi:MAG TPA: RDD family protein [Candidatus Xenobia bacterium]|nr:RDD family protein [Candidatus Xenobia bacterium]